MNDLKRLVSILAVVAAPLAAQEAPAEEEAPEAIFSEKIGDVGVELTADGTWTTHFATGWGSGFTPDGSLPGLGYPGFAKQPEFEQIPDFSMTLWLLKRYYLEVNYRTTTDDRSLLLGYQGQQGELLQWAKLGNASFGVPARAGEQLPEGRPGAPAAGAAFSLGTVSLEALARYEDGSRETHTYRGYDDVSQSVVAVDTWIRGRFFRVPGTSGIRVLVEDPSGPFGGFRDAKAGEAVIDASGEIRLPSPAARRYLVTWSTAPDGALPATPLLKIVAAEFSGSNLPAGDWYVLTQPGVSTAFELRNRYPVPAGVTGAIRLYDNDSSVPVTGWPVSQSPANDWFQVAGTEEAPFFNAGNGYEFQGIYPYRDEGVPPASAKALRWVFRLPVTANATSYSLGTDVIPSSLVVQRNGIVTTAWTFDATSGTLQFDTPVFDTDTVVISLQRRKTGATAADLVLWHGGRWDISEKQNLEWNVQSRWNMSADRSTDQDLQSPGRIATTMAWTGTEGPWAWSLTGTAGALKTDSTGHRVLYGQDDAGSQASLDSDGLRPSAAPGDSLGGLPGGPTNLDDTNRAPTYYRDYWTSDPLTGTPVAGKWGKPGVGQEPFAAGGVIGPYLVQGDGQRTDRMAVIEADLDALHPWAGLQVFVDKGRPADLRSASAITVNVRVPNTVLGSDKLYFQAGTLSTNFDGTRALRTVTYREDPSLPFFSQDPAVAATQYFPMPEGSIWGNDPSSVGSTVPDAELASFDLAASGLSAASTGWQTVRIILSDSDRQKLQAATGWRLIAYGTTGSSRTVLVGPVVFEGSTWSVVPDGSTAGSVNPAELDAGKGRQLRVDWTGRNSWKIQGRQNPMRPLSYGTIAFKYSASGLGPSGTTLSFKLSDYKGRGITATWNVSNADTATHQARISIRDKTLTIDGAPTGSVALSGGAMTTTWDRMIITQTGSAGGTATISEIEAVDPQWEPIANSLVTATWTQGAAWPSAQMPLVSGMTVGVTSRQEGVTAETASWRGQTTWNGSLGPLISSGLASYATSPEGSQSHGEYQATLPLAWPGGPSLALTEQFSDEGLRAERVVLGLPLLGTWETFAKASGPPATLDQDYGASWNGRWTGDWAASLSAEWNQSRAFSGTVGSFGRQWVDSWSWLAPGADTAPYYLLQSQATFKTPFFGGPLDLQARSQVAQSIGPTTTWSPSGSWQLRSTIRLGDTGWSIVPSVSRQVSAVFERAAAAPQSSAAVAAEWIWTQPDGLASWPFSESAASVSPWSRAPDGLDSATLQSTARLDWNRTQKQDWTDLVVPRSGGGEYRTLRGIDGLAEYRAYEVGGHLEAQGINLFGSLGTEPVFTWYRTDVWTWTAAGLWQTGTRVQDRLAQASAAVRSELVLTTEESVALPTSYQGIWSTTPSQTWNLQPTWSLKRPANLPFELPRWLSPKSFRQLWVQEVSTALVFGWTPEPAPPLRDLHVTWKGRFILSEGSELDFTTQWGQQWQNDLTVVGLELAIDFILSF